MILYGSYTSPYARHCRIALSESELEWQFKDTDYEGSASGSPCQRVPFLEDEGLKLTDSSSILLHVRTLQNRPFIENVTQMELFTMSNTAMDAAINLFLLERDGLTVQNSAYLSRQSARIDSLMQELSKTKLSANSFKDSEIRLACFLDWAQFRERVDLNPYPELMRFLAAINRWDTFADTSPAKT